MVINKVGLMQSEEGKEFGEGKEGGSLVEGGRCVNTDAETYMYRFHLPDVAGERSAEH